MREDAPELLEFDSGEGNQIVNDSDVGFRDDAELVIQQVIVVFMD